MSRIDSDKISLGESFIVEAEKSNSRSGSQQDLEDIETKGFQIIEQAKIEAERIISDAKVQAASEATVVADKIKKDAREMGYKTGYDEGYQSGFKTGYNQAASEVSASIKHEFSEKLSLFNNYIKSIFDIKKRVIRSLHMELTDLIANIVDAICLKKNSLDSETIKRLIQHAMLKLKEKDNETVTLIVHPKIKKQILEILDFIRSENTMISEVKVVEDPSLTGDGVIVETMKERIDATFSSHMKNVVNAILDDSNSFSEDNLLAEYKDVFSELDYKETSIIEAASKSEIEDAMEVSMDNVTVPEPPPMGEEIQETINETVEEVEAEVVIESSPSIEESQTVTIENSDMAVTYEAPVMAFEAPNVDFQQFDFGPSNSVQENTDEMFVDTEIMEQSSSENIVNENLSTGEMQSDENN